MSRLAVIDVWHSKLRFAKKKKKKDWLSVLFFSNPKRTAHFPEMCLSRTITWTILASCLCFWHLRAWGDTRQKSQHCECYAVQRWSINWRLTDLMSCSRPRTLQWVIFLMALNTLIGVNALFPAALRALSNPAECFIKGWTLVTRETWVWGEKLFPGAVKSRELRNATHRWCRVQNRTKVTLMESVLSPRCIFVPLTKQGNATLNDKHHPDKLIQLITFERGLGQLFEKT